MDTNYYKVGTIQGWQCPICKRVLAPFVQECPCKGQEIKNYTTVSTQSQNSKTITIHN